MGVTIRDVAEEASVSATTVSRVFNHDHLVNRETRERVMEVARRMGYSPNETARNLSHGRTQSLGVLLPAPHGEFFSELIRGLDDAAQAADHYLLIASSHYSPTEGASALQSLAGRVDGLVIMTPRVQAEALIGEMGPSIPTIFVNSDLGDRSFDLFGIENRKGAMHVVRHLVEQGHTRIAAITGPAGSFDVERRMAGYHQALEAHDLPTGPIMEGDFTQKSGYEAGQQILALSERPDAVFACNDYMAIGAMAAFQEAGLHIPDDIAVAGFDDIASARYATPALTTIRVPVYEIGRRAGERLVERIQSGESLEAERFTLPHELKARASTAA